MKALAIFFYIIGASFLIASCFTTGHALSWWLGGAAIISLFIGCVLQYNAKKQDIDSLIDDRSNTHFNA